MNKKIYIVSGSTGEYDDARDWVVGWCETKKEADEKTEFLNSLCKEKSVYGATRRDRVAYESREKAQAEMYQYDPFCSIDYNGVRYDVHEVNRLKKMGAKK